MTSNDSSFNPLGSLWNRWDPHIHTPGTALNDQYTGDERWTDFLQKLDSADPDIRAVGITDYCTIERYKELLALKKRHNLPNVGLLFPNVELRLSLETRKSSAVNIHLLFDPAPDDHIDQIERFLLELEFTFRDVSYRCTASDLIRLGRAFRSDDADETFALREGANQFKVEFSQLRQVWKKTPWVQDHGLIAVAGGEKDGTSGLRDRSSSFAAHRQEIEAYSHIIFSSNPKQIDFWLGSGAASLEQLEKEWKGPKPCLHGSDAHNLDNIGAPSQDRFCWIKGDLSFETLRQACLEPEGRVHIGKTPPSGPLESHTVDCLEVNETPWLSSKRVQLNPGLVTVIGARGSGKTALVDLIAAGGYSLSRQLNDKSFIRRARDHLEDGKAVLHWGSGEQTSNDLIHAEHDDVLAYPYIQYLSQDFVDQLCSSEGLDDALVSEIEKVIFNAHAPDSQQGARSFQELLGIRLESSKTKRLRQIETLREISQTIARERAAQSALKGLRKERSETLKEATRLKKDQKGLLSGSNKVHVERHEKISQAIKERRIQIQAEEKNLQALKHLKDDTEDFRERQGPAIVAKWKEARSDAKLTDDDWKLFHLDFSGDVEALIEKKRRESTKRIDQLKGPSIDRKPEDEAPKSDTPIIRDDEALGTVSLSLLEQEEARIGKLIGIQKQNEKRFAMLTEKLRKAERAVSVLDQKIEHASSAGARIENLIKSRRNAYEAIFAAIVEEEEELRSLYVPIERRIAEAEGALSKLSFSVHRMVDVKEWAREGEGLLDLRKSGPFKGRDTLLNIAREKLLPDWSKGSAQDASNALLEFAKANEEALKIHRPEAEDSRRWAERVSEWLYGTGHISIGYGLKYDGVEIEQLSPGTRGIVLLLLYLGIDSEDIRPLIIDQPEENLDPRSIFQELVGLIRGAKRRRQIILVTHNSNLVVNTDADQVVVAHSSPHKAGMLPDISYTSGSLENPSIRQDVCNILEGGERAFRERAKRLRVDF